MSKLLNILIFFICLTYFIKSKLSLFVHLFVMKMHLYYVAMIFIAVGSLPKFSPSYLRLGWVQMRSPVNPLSKYWLRIYQY